MCVFRMLCCHSALCMLRVFVWIRVGVDCMVFLHLPVYLYSTGQWVVSVSRRSMCANMICRRVLTFIRFHTNQNVYKIPFVYHTVGWQCRTVSMFLHICCDFVERASSALAQLQCVWISDLAFCHFASNNTISVSIMWRNSCRNSELGVICIQTQATISHQHSEKKNCLRNTFECLILLRLSIHCFQTAIWAGLMAFAFSFRAIY